MRVDLRKSAGLFAVIVATILLFATAVHFVRRRSVSSLASVPSTGPIAVAETNAPPATVLTAKTVYQPSLIPILLDAVQVTDPPAAWGDEGFFVNKLAISGGKSHPGFDSKLRLAWTTKGLLAMAIVAGSPTTESDSAAHLWDGASIEFFLANESHSQGVMVNISPGIDPRFTKPRCTVLDFHGNVRTDAGVQFASTTAGQNYTVTALIPWKSIGVKAKEGLNLRFQAYVNVPFETGKDTTVFTWFPSENTFDDWSRTSLIQLGNGGDAPVNAEARAWYDATLQHIDLSLIATPELAGHAVEIRASYPLNSTGTRVLTGQTSAVEGEARYAASVPLPDNPRMSLSFDVLVDGLPVNKVELEGLYATRLWLFQDLRYTFGSGVFAGNKFPAGSWNDAEKALACVGPHTVKVTFYDADYNVVTTAEHPGRYGAVVEVKRADTGAIVRRFCTLCRVPDDRLDATGVAGLMHRLGESPTVQTAGEFPGAAGLTARILNRPADNRAAAIVATAIEPVAPPRLGKAWIENRKWWTVLKRQIYDLTGATPPPLVLDQTATAPVLREGTAAEAGLDPDVVPELDAFCAEMLKKHPELPFNVCIARHGIVFFQRAIGRFNGQPMTLETPGTIYSVGKLFTGSLLLMLVDRGEVRLDDPIGKYLPPLRNIVNKPPLTIRRLMNHNTGDMPWGGPFVTDFEESIAFVAPEMEVGKFGYSSAADELVGEMIEDMTGQDIVDLTEQLLLKPLGMDHTIAIDETDRDSSTANDLAKLGQMMLNRGAYGRTMFMRPESFSKMAPIDGNIDGIGTRTANPGEKMGRGAYGHNSSNPSFVWINPSADTVVALVSPSTNAGIGSPFFPIIYDNIFQLVPTSRKSPQVWRFTTARPANDWMQNTFDATDWETGPAPFGHSYPNVRTPWTDTPGDIWIRREVTIPANIPARLEVLTLHDEDVEIYINGILAASAKGFDDQYVNLPMSDAARASLKPGMVNVIAAHCHQTTGGQVLDVGITAP